MTSEPIVLTIAGSDSGGGAGIQADLQAIRDAGCFGVTAVTAITAQNTQGVRRVDPVPVAGVVAQLEALADDLPLAAIKIGMLGTAALTWGVVGWLRDLSVRPPVVLDPVMVATSGDRLLDLDAVRVLREALVPLATLVTPNLPEARWLTEVDSDDPYVLSEALVERGGCAALVTGGDAQTEDVVDLLRLPGGELRCWRRPRLAGGPFHGTGCTLSSAIAARLAHGASLQDAAEEAIDEVRARLQQAWRPGRGASVLGRRG